MSVALSRENGRFERDAGRPARIDGLRGGLAGLMLPGANVSPMLSVTDPPPPPEVNGLRILLLGETGVPPVPWRLPGVRGISGPPRLGGT